MPLSSTDSSTWNKFVSKLATAMDSCGEEKDESHINIGADDNHEGTNPHEDAAFDYCEVSDKKVKQNDVPRPASVPMEAEVNGQEVLVQERTRPMFGDGTLQLARSEAGEPILRQRIPSLTQWRSEMPSAIEQEEHRKLLARKKKAEKEKAKKTAGWTKSDKMEGHKDLDIDATLEFVGESTTVDQTRTSQTQKKKLRKKTSTARQKTVNTQSLNGKGQLHTSTSSSSESEATDSTDLSSPNELPSTSSNHPLTTALSNNTVTNGVSDYLVNGEEVGKTIVDNEFKQVHRKKKNTPKSATPSDISKPTTSSVKSGDKPMRPARPNGFVKNSLPSSMAKSTNNSIPSSASVDLSLNSFPALERRRASAGDIKSSPSQGESMSNTDDDRDSVVSQPMTNGPSVSSWAKIAAKPTQPQVPAPVSKVSDSSPNDKTNQNDLNKTESTDWPEISSTVDIKSPYTGDEITAKDSLPVDEPTTDPVQEVSSLTTPADRMSKSTGNVSIEFGTVTNSNDLTTDQKVQTILSQSYTEGVCNYKLVNHTKAVPKSSNKCNLSTSPSKSHLVRKSSSKGVEFLDKHNDFSNNNINITFGFVDLDEIAQKTLSSPMSMSYPPPDRPSQPPPVMSMSADQPLLMPSNTIQDRTSDIIPAKATTHGVNILQKILSATVPRGKYRQRRTATTHDDKFDVGSTVRMLRKEWEEVMSSKNGNRKSVYNAQELNS